MPALVECVPNFSEGRRAEVIEALAAAVREVPGVQVLDVHRDPDHNRCVVTFVGEPRAAAEAAFRATARARDLIDLTRHQGEHPRIGATDVIPFVPLFGLEMADAVALARELGRRIASELNIPVYLYEAAATRPDRRNLADIRRGEFEALRETIATPERRPDFGPPAVHPTAGATVVGARKPLVAYNVNLGTGDVKLARAIARAVRGSSGGLVNVKALGLRLGDRGIAQVSMNLVDTEATPIYRAVELVRVEARRHGVPVIGSEVVGLVPAAALIEAARYYLGLEGFRDDQVLELRLLEALRAGAEGTGTGGSGEAPGR